MVVGLMSLWLPILLAAVFVFVASSVLHMVLPYHKSDVQKLPGEDRIMQAMRAEGVTRGSYMFPHCDHKDMNLPESKAKFEAGPVGILHVLPNGQMALGKYLALWFGYTILVGIFAGYITGHTLGPGAHYLGVFRVAGSTAFMAYGLSEISSSIWKAQTWSVTAKHMFDGLIYSLLTAGTFGWLWPA